MDSQGLVWTCQVLHLYAENSSKTTRQNKVRNEKNWSKITRRIITAYL